MLIGKRMYIPNWGELVGDEGGCAGEGWGGMGSEIYLEDFEIGPCHFDGLLRTKNLYFSF